MKELFYILLFSIITQPILTAQDPHRFDEEIKRFSTFSVAEGEKVIVFTGSSSIRFWEDLKTDCEGANVINTGFGGSHMSDLLYFLEQTVLRFQPTKVYIYEGDNDVSAGKDAKTILETTKTVVKKILASNDKTEIHFISAKPSPSRWNFKNQYLEFNELLKKYCDNHPQLFYVDVWNPMINDAGRPKPNIFISDSLHMNRQGYLLWKEIICEDSK